MRPLDGFYGILLDGQQRPTSLSPAIQSEAEAEQEHRAFFDVENEAIYLGKASKTIERRIRAGDPLLAPLSDLVQAGDGSVVQVTIQKVIQALREQERLGRGESKEAVYRDRLHRVAGLLVRPVPPRTCYCQPAVGALEAPYLRVLERLRRGELKLPGTASLSGARDQPSRAPKRSRLFPNGPIPAPQMGFGLWGSVFDILQYLECSNRPGGR